MPKKTGIVTKIVLDLDNKEDPNKTVKEARLLVELFEAMDYKVVVVASGKKGLHIHIKVLQMSHEKIDKGIESYFMQLKQKLDLTSLDIKVIADQTARVIRLPGSLNNNGNPCVPVDIWSADKIEDMTWPPLKSQKIQEGDGNLEKTILRCAEMNKNFKPVQTHKSEAYNMITEINWNIMHKVFPDLYETGTHTTGNHHIVRCPFHTDANPSAFYNEKLFHCSSCNISVGVWNMLTKHSGYNNADAMKIVKTHQ